MRRHVGKAEYYRGVATMPYDLVKELCLAMAGVLIVVLVLSATLSSPDVPSVTIQSWAKADPIDFVTTASGELAGSTTVSNYGPPYNSGTGSLQTWGAFKPQAWAGVHVAVDTTNDFVLTPLQQSSSNDPVVMNALSTFTGASNDQQQKWLTNYTNALGNATASGDSVSLPNGNYGPVPALMDRMLSLGRSGALDGLLLANAHFYQTDFTKALLFMDDGTYLSGLAQQQMLTGSQWGMMNETGRYPGQAWLWLYTMWYQVFPYNSSTGALGVSSANADLAVVATMLILSLLLILVPFIPGLRDLPRLIPIHRLIWRRHYADVRRSRSAVRAA